MDNAGYVIPWPDNHSRGTGLKFFAILDDSVQKARQLFDELNKDKESLLDYNENNLKPRKYKAAGRIKLEKDW